MNFENWQHGLTERENDDATAEASTICDKWILSSALQKLIRRGRSVQSIAVAAQLHAVDPSYLRRRLPIIVMEDIGVGDIELCKEVVSVCASSKFWGDFAGHSIEHLIPKMALTVKSRAVCDAYCLTEAHPDSSHTLHTFLKLGAMELVKIVTSRKRQQLDRLIALRVLGGITFEGGGYKRLSKFDRTSLDMVAQALGLPESIRWLIAQNTKMAGLAAMLPVVWELMEAPQVKAGEGFPRSMDVVGGMPACALDRYTRIGKAAFKRLYLVSDPLQAFMQQHAQCANPIALINIAMFQIESSVLDSYLATPELAELKMLTDESELVSLGLTDSACHGELYRLLRTSADFLLQQRLNCWHQIH